MQTRSAEELAFPELIQSVKQRLLKEWDEDANDALAECFQRLQSGLYRQLREIDERVQRVQTETQVTTTSLQNVNNSLLLIANRQFVQNRIGTADDAAHRNAHDKSERDGSDGSSDDSNSHTSSDDGEGDRADATAQRDAMLREATPRHSPPQPRARRPREALERDAVLHLRQRLVEFSEEALDQRIIPVILPGDEREEMEAERAMCVRRTRYRKRRVFAYLGSSTFERDPYGGLYSTLTGRTLQQDMALASANVEAQGSDDDDWGSDDEGALDKDIHKTRTAPYKVPIPLLLSFSAPPASPRGAKAVVAAAGDSTLLPFRLKPTATRHSAPAQDSNAVNASDSRHSGVARVKKRALFGSSSSSLSSSSSSSSEAAPRATTTTATAARSHAGAARSLPPPATVKPSTTLAKKKKNLFGSSSSSSNDDPVPVVAKRTAAALPARHMRVATSSSDLSSSTTSTHSSTSAATELASTHSPRSDIAPPGPLSDEVNARMSASFTASVKSSSADAQDHQPHPPQPAPLIRVVSSTVTAASALPKADSPPPPPALFGAGEDEFLIAPPPPPNVFADLIPPPPATATATTVPLVPLAPAPKDGPTTRSEPARLPPRGGNVLSTSSDDDDS